MTTSSPSEHGRIVVGVDGSEASLAALRWGADEARRRGLGLHVVTCWSYPMLPWGPYQPPLSGEGFELEARDVAEAAIEKVLEADHDRPDVTIEVLQGPASLRLLALAGGADMLVVGSRGRGGFAGLMLGSVSQHLAEYADCPVVIVRPRAEPDRPRPSQAAG